MKNPVKDALEAALDIAWSLWEGAVMDTDLDDAELQGFIDGIAQNAIVTFLTSLPSTTRIVIGRQHFTGQQVKQMLWGAVNEAAGKAQE